MNGTSDEEDDGISHDIIAGLTPYCRYITAIKERTFLKNLSPISEWNMY